MTYSITESTIEQATLDWFKELDYTILHGPEIAPGELFSERASYSDVILTERLRSALATINPEIPQEAIEDAYRKLSRLIHEFPHLYANNHRFHRILTEGLDVEYRNSEGRIVGDKVWLIDFDNIDNSNWLVVNQFTVIEGQSNRRPDVVVFINGLPLGVIESKKTPVMKKLLLKQLLTNSRHIRLKYHPYSFITKSLLLQTE